MKRWQVMTLDGVRLSIASIASILLRLKRRPSSLDLTMKSTLTPLLELSIPSLVSGRDASDIDDPISTISGWSLRE